MKRNVHSDEQIPRIGLAAAAGIASLWVPTWLKTGLLGMAAGLLASVATGYCPVKAALTQDVEEPTWTTLKTNRVQA